MTWIYLVFSLLFAAIVSTLLAQFFPKLSSNYISMIIGSLLFFITNELIDATDFNSDIFMGLVIAPLLFFEAQTTHLNIVSQKTKHILQMTLSLIIINTFIMALGLWLIVGIGLSFSFVLASIGTPTDATALASVTTGKKIPKDVNILLKLESLFNDAPGIVLLNFVFVWYSKGQVNLLNSLKDFVWSSLGGLAFGITIAWLLILFRQFLLRSSYNSLNAQTALYIATPFILYYASESLHLSGVLTVVSAGLIHNAEAQRSRLISPVQVHLGFDLISMITELSNSVVFIVLGFLLLDTVTAHDVFSHHLFEIALLSAIILYGLNIITRYIYGIIRLHLNHHNGLIFALGGIHGAVTLSLAYSLSGSNIKLMHIDLLLATIGIYILLSMLIPTVFYRYLLQPEATDDLVAKEVQTIRQEMRA